MKVAHQVLTLCALTTVVKGWYSPLSGGHLSLPSSSNGLVSGSRASRQSTEANSPECNRLQAKGDCSVAQKIINAISRCGSRGNRFAKMIEMGCRQNFAQEYCQAVAVPRITEACKSNCSEECSNIFTIADCCHFQTDEVRNYFNTCKSGIPSACPKTSLSIPTSSDDANCSSVVNFSVYLANVTCNNGQPTYNSLISNDNCQNDARQFEQSCRDRNMKNCIIQVESTANSVLFNKTIANCPSISTCSPSCRSSLNDLNSNLGCCLNIRNASLSVGVDQIYFVVTDNDLWLKCSITPPGICESPFTAAASSPYVIAGNIAFLVVSSFLLTFV